MSDCKEWKKENVGNENRFAGGIKTSTFYGSVSNDRLFTDTCYALIKPLDLCQKFRKLSSPSTEWKTFRKQHDVIHYVNVSNLDLLPFTYQDENGDRLFLAAHPKSFWYIDEQRNAENRHSYEIIQEFKPCKLYFDLEFDRTLQPDHNGYNMVKTFINLVCAALKDKYSVSSDESNVLNLDSTSETKFSCHLIFQNVNFVNNYEAGYFVKDLCNEIRSLKKNTEWCILQNVDDLDSIEKLFVYDSKGNQKLFCDEGVYTKNRHFRLYKSSKYGKNVSLEVSKYNSFKIQSDSTARKEELTFLCSLITYYYLYPQELLRYECNGSNLPEFSNNISTNSINNNSISSPYTDIDKCISKIVYPGKIYRSNFFPEKKILTYDIIGNRYCGNIGREHKSNNVKYIVNVSDLTYYQKCHDPDCAKYRSEKKTLPIDEKVFLNYNIDDELLISALEQFESSACAREVHEHQKLKKDFDETDDNDLLANTKTRKSLVNHKTSKYIDTEDDTVLSAVEKCGSSMEVDALFPDDSNNLICSIAEQCELLMNANERRESITDNFFDSNVDNELIITAEKCELFVKNFTLKDNTQTFPDNIGDDLLVKVTEQCESSFNNNKSD